MVSENITQVTTSRMNRRSLLKRAGLIGVALPLAGGLLNACSDSDESARAGGLTPDATPAGDAAASTGGVTELTLTAMDIKFEPTNLAAAAGQPVRLTFVNKGAVEHDWKIYDIKVDGLKVVAEPSVFTPRIAGLLEETGAESAPYAGATPNDQMTIEFTPTTPGTYEMMCMVPGHQQAGMKGSFTVTGAGGHDATPSADHEGDGHSMPTVPTGGTPYAAERLPLPAVAEPVGTRAPQVVKEEIEIREIVGYLDEGVAYEFWTFGGTIPGPMLRVRVGDTVELTLTNPAENKMTHNIDLHAVTGPGGGGHATMVAPGQSATFRFKTLNPGVFVYHCATPPIPHHISAGMYGLIVVEPEGGLPPVDREFYVMQGDFYLDGARGQQGLRTFSMDKLLDERPDYVVFNGAVGAVSPESGFTANVGETVRIFFGVGGPNHISSFHVIGEIFDRVMHEGATEWSTNVQTTLVPAGGATIVEFKAEVPGTLVLVDHSLGRLGKGAAGTLEIVGDDNLEVFEVIAPAH